MSLTPESYVADRVQHVLGHLDPEDRKAVEAYLSSEITQGTLRSLKSRVGWRIGTAFGLALGLTGPLAYFLVQMGGNLTITLPSFPEATCEVCPPAPVCPVAEVRAWSGLEEVGSSGRPTSLKRSINGAMECVSFSNGAVTCIPVFQAPDRVETPK